MTLMTLNEQLAEIGLRFASDNLDDFLAQVIKRRYSPVQLLEHLYRLESQERAQRSRQNRLIRSRIGSFKPMADFDWNWPKQIDRALVESMLNINFVTESRNVVLVAAQGLGKTMIAQNIAYQAVQAGHSTLFITAAKLLLDLAGSESARALDRRLQHYSRFRLLCIDELGYLSYDNRGADLLFEVINRRYEKKSVVLTTNLNFSEWPSIFPNATCATALIDRIIHHADIIGIEGESYRRREAQAYRTRAAKRA